MKNALLCLPIQKNDFILLSSFFTQQLMIFKNNYKSDIKY